MARKNTTHPGKPESSPVAAQAKSKDAEREVDKQADNPLQHPIWQSNLSGASTPPPPTNSRHNFANIPVLQTSSPQVQAKLTIGAPNDKYEQEADRVADQVMRMPDTQNPGDVNNEEEEKETNQDTIQAKPAGQQVTPVIQKQTDDSAEKEDDEEHLQAKFFSGQSNDFIQRQEDDEEETLQAKQQSGATTDIPAEVASGIQSLQGGGQPLPESNRSFFEPRLGHDLSKVRVHNNHRAANLASSVNARAFTVGQNVVFGKGQYQPETSNGKHLIAHEMTHVIQQNASLNKASVWAKREVDRAGDKPLWAKHGNQGNTTSPLISSSPKCGLLLQRQGHKHKKAKKDFKKFVAGRYKFPNFAIGTNGKFDVDYQPAANLVDINVNVKFEFPDDQQTFFGWLLGIGEAARLARLKKYRQNYIKRVTKQWSQRYNFKNVRAPQAVWGKLNPTAIKVNVKEVAAGQHFLIKAYTKTAGRAQVHKGVTKLYKGNETPQPAFNPGTRKGELKRVKRINPSPILFAHNSATIKGAFRPKLKFFATYLKRINNPKFNIDITGHTNTPGKKADNQKLSERRAKAVQKSLKRSGLVNHTLNWKGLGETGATANAKWRKAMIKVDIPAGWKNKQDVTAHEFGHMVGLGDEYGAGLATHYGLTKKAFGKKYAQQVAKKGDTDYASIMEGGDDVRIQHYVTFWSALSETTLKKAPVPIPKFGYNDWKFIG